MSQSAPGRWIRVSEAAARVGVPPRVLTRTLQTRPDLGVRLQFLGRRPLVYVAEADVEILAARLQQETV